MSIAESRFGRLTGHFFAGFLENDLLFSTGVEMQALLAQVIGLLTAPTIVYCMFFCTLKYGSYLRLSRETMAWDDRLLFIHGTMVVIGLLVVIQWDSLLPDRRDYHALGPLPVTMRVVLSAKLAAILLLALALWAAGNVATALLFPLVSMSSHDPLAEVGHQALAHVTATLAAGAFSFLLFACLQGVLLALLPAKWYRRASVYAQVAAVLALVVAFLATPVLVAKALPGIRNGQPWVYNCPQFWFLGLYQVLLGRGGAVFNFLAAEATRALAVTAAVALLAFGVGYRRHVRRSLESLDGGRTEAGWMGRAAERALHALVLRHPLERAQFAFMRATMLRSRLHTLLLTGFFGVGFALALAVMADTGMRATPPAGVLAVEPALLVFVLGAMRYVFTLPAELRANWQFAAADPADRRQCISGVRKTMLIFGAGPVLIALGPVHGFLWGWGSAATQTAFVAALAVLGVELLLTGFDKLPFTCSYQPGKANVQLLLPICVIVFARFMVAIAITSPWLSKNPMLLPVFCAIPLAGAALVRYYDSRRFGPEFHFVFEDVPEPAVQTLNIAHGAAHAPARS